ncbi:ATP synthase subunit delta', mitochondrial [Gossypium australe]|uniref:ATP synthase subunit delta', mitochondrial n=1 Tax=Gossypium australe TaxID=47621 RepID=A0A5B6VJC8_9ROSI|nr:ATP synthase subunit delta', mitochondrial [Gossypium australe]
MEQSYTQIGPSQDFICFLHPFPRKRDGVRLDLRSAINGYVDMVIVPATTGHMGVLPRHVPTIA